MATTTTPGIGTAIANRAKDKPTTIIGLVAGFLANLAPQVLPPEWVEVSLQAIGTASGVALVLLAGGKTKEDVDAALATNPRK